MRVAVVGGGPAGMEAARVAALKGHDVTLYEKRELGGALIEAAIPEFKAPDLGPLEGVPQDPGAPRPASR